MGTIFPSREFMSGGKFQLTEPWSAKILDKVVEEVQKCSNLVLKNYSKLRWLEMSNLARWTATSIIELDFLSCSKGYRYIELFLVLSKTISVFKLTKQNEVKSVVITRL